MNWNEYHLEEHEYVPRISGDLQDCGIIAGRSPKKNEAWHTGPAGLNVNDRRTQTDAGLPWR